MGDFLKSLGLSGGQVPQDPHMSEAVMGMPSVSMGGLPNSVSANAPVLPMQDPDITVVGDGWHPHKESFLKKLADGYLMSQGLKPAFQNKIDEQDLVEAMQGFDQDPVKAIRRLNQMKGQQKNAWDMYNTYSDNNRLQGNLDRQNKVFDLKMEDYVRDRVAGMMGSVPQGDTAAYKTMRERALAYAQAKNIDLSADLPENGTSLDIDALKYGQIDPYKQERLKQFDTQEQGRNSRFQQGEAGKNSRTATTQAGTESRFERGQAAAQGRFNQLHPPVKRFMTERGPAELSPDGRHFRLAKDGSVWEFQDGGKAKRVK